MTIQIASLSALRTDDAERAAGALLDAGYEGLILEEPLHHDAWQALRLLLPRDSVKAIRLFLPYPRTLRPGQTSPYVAAAEGREERAGALLQARKTLEAADQLGAPLVLLPMTPLGTPGLSRQYRLPTDSLGADEQRLRAASEETSRRMDSLLLLLADVLEQAERYATTICLTPGNRSGELPLASEVLDCLREFEGAALGLWLDTSRLPAEFLRAPVFAEEVKAPLAAEMFGRVQGASLRDETAAGEPCSLGRGAVPWDLISSTLRALPLWCVQTTPGESPAEGLHFLASLEDEKEEAGGLFDR